MTLSVFNYIVIHCLPVLLVWSRCIYRTNVVITIIQIDFKTSMLCSIEKGIVKKQLPFSIVKSSDDGVGSRFSISFKGRHDYELEATSVEDKQKVNVYSV